MKTVKVNIETLAGAKVTFTRQSDDWDDLNQYERDDTISQWVNENPDVQAAISGSNGYTLSWTSN
ncbi:hypothetical protein OMR58_24835 [Erwinia sp. INIA-01]|uniref:hypothetical protein n=1 Tax=Erwinia sp. INIA01 TaxID=2991500 RepID=UPI0022252363|nr:hypothetical protein [Erwinia sp. INIA01]MCW1877669.1 hypothetical protein [Erwinia sp. INIA01]